MTNYKIIGDNLLQVLAEEFNISDFKEAWELRKAEMLRENQVRRDEYNAFWKSKIK